MYLRSGACSGNRSEDLRFGKVLCCVFSRHVLAELNTKLAGLAQAFGQEAWPCGSDHCHTRCCWHSIGDAAETTTIDDDEDDLGTDIRMHEELKRVKMDNSRLRRRCGRLRIKLASIGEDSRAVSTKCAHVNLETSLVPAWYDLASVISS